MSDSRTVATSSHVVEPFRLDLTVSVLRRLSSNVVDVLTPDVGYIRALAGDPARVVVRATQSPTTASLLVSAEAGAMPRAVEIVERTLGVARDLSEFNSAAVQVPWLAPLVRRMHGVKPPRYPTLWEGCANAIVFQQVSLRAASTIMKRLIIALGQPVDVDGRAAAIYVFPDATRFQNAPDALLRGAGLSGAKAAALRAAADALTDGTLNEAALEQCSSDDAAARLREIKGIGPWTAAVILLRGLGRLDVFPANDTSIASNIALVAGSADFDSKRLLDMLGTQRGMLYFYLLLARLEARGEIGIPSVQ